MPNPRISAGYYYQSSQPSHKQDMRVCSWDIFCLPALVTHGYVVFDVFENFECEAALAFWVILLSCALKVKAGELVVGGASAAQPSQPSSSSSASPSTSTGPKEGGGAGEHGKKSAGLLA